MAFSPEHYIRGEPDPVEWERLIAQTKQSYREHGRQLAQNREQQRQFDAEQERLRTAAMLQAKANERTAGIAANRLAFDVAKEQYDQAQAARKLENEGINLLMKSWKESKNSLEFSGAAQMISKGYGITIMPKGQLPAWAVPAGPPTATGVPPPPGMEPPAGMAPPPAAAPPAQPAAPAAPAAAQPGQAPAPAGTGGFAPDINTGIYAPGGPEAQRAAMEEGMIGELSPGKGVTPAGKLVSGVITKGAVEVAKAFGIDNLGVTPDVPSIPEEAPTAEGAKVVNEANPASPAPQQMPAKNYSELARRLVERKPVTYIETEDRLSTDQQIEMSMKERVEQIKAAGLTPAQESAAINRAAKAHGLPPMPIPPVAVPDPGAPLEVQGTGDLTVELPAEIAALADAPPKLVPSTVRDGRTSGGFDFWSDATGQQIGSLNWNELQEARVSQIMEDWQPIIDLADNESDERKLTSAVDAYARSQNEKALDVMLSFIARKEKQAYHAEQTERANAAEARVAVQDMTKEMVRIKDTLIENNGLVAMQQIIQDTERALETLRNDPSSTEQRKAMSDLLAAAYTRRSTDQDANRLLKTNFWSDLKEYKNYFVGGGDLSPAFLDNMEKILDQMNKAERAKREKYAGILHEQVMNSVLNQSTDMNLAKSLAAQAVGEAFPDLGHETIVHTIGESLRMRRERITGVREPEQRAAPRKIDPKDLEFPTMEEIDDFLKED